MMMIHKTFFFYFLFFQIPRRCMRQVGLSVAVKIVALSKLQGTLCEGVHLKSTPEPKEGKMRVAKPYGCGNCK